jgi:hypothetical protein
MFFDQWLQFRALLYLVLKIESHEKDYVLSYSWFYAIS